MALFRGVDERLPVLTQLYQVSDEVELEALVERFDPYQGEFSEDLDQAEGWELLRLVRLFLSALADDTALEAAVVNRLAELSNQTTLVKAVDTRASISPGLLPVLAEGVVQARDVVFRAESHPFPSLVLLELREAIGQRKEFRRCAECCGVFVPVRAGHGYCSHRCADRVSARRRRIENRIE